MTDEEKNYFFFKVHDLDGNDKLDGLEIFYSATHHSEAESLSTDSESHHHHHHEHEEQTETVPAIESTDNEIDKTNESKTTDEQSSDSTQNSSETTNLKLLEIDGNDDGGGSKNINHIIGRLTKKEEVCFAKTRNTKSDANLLLLPPFQMCLTIS